MMTNETTVTSSSPDPRLAPPSPGLVAVVSVVLASVAWSFWPALKEMWQSWSIDPRYSHGFLVPAFSVYLLWHRRGLLAGVKPASSSRWWGIPLLLLGAGLKLFSARYFILWLDGIALLPTLAGVCVILGGLPALKWSWQAIGFLFFMIPLPARVENAVGPPLQRLATVVSTYILQTFGLPAQAEGNIINLEDVQIGVVEACNGLGMLMMFFAYATAVAMVIKRPLIDRIILVLSAAPIAMVANILRIATTGLLHAFSTRAIADHVYHDLAGWLMMPMALAMFGAELYILSKLFIEIETPTLASLKPWDMQSRASVSPLVVDVRSIRRDSAKDKGRP
jgi:exosortase